jgi:predicted MPP superfamily phosphohydrolase
MKLFHETEINCFSDQNLKICIISDIHFSYHVKTARLRALQKRLKIVQPDYIFIPGDIVDSNDMIKNPAEETRLLSFLKGLGEIAPTIISKGNHDVFHKPSKLEQKTLKSRWRVQDNPSFRSKFNELKNVSYLDDAAFEDEKIYAFCLTASPETYCLSRKKPRRDPKTGEDKKSLLLDLEKHAKTFKNLPSAKKKFILIHTPASLADEKIRQKLSGFDFIISGHMHNGLVFPLLFELWPSDRGIISASKKLFTKFTRTTKKTLDQKLIINGAVTTWHESVGILHLLNAFYPSYFTTIKFSKHNSKTPKIKHRYLKF